MAIKIILLIIFFGVMIFIGFWSRRHATNVNDYVLGGRTVGPWLTAFAFGTSYFSSVVFVGYAGTPASSAGSSALRPPGSVWGTPLSVLCSRGSSLADALES